MDNVIFEGTIFPSIKKSDVMFIDNNGIYWIYIEEKEVLLLNKSGIKIIPFSECRLEDVEKWEEEAKHNIENITFHNGKKRFNLEDLDFRKE